MLADDHIEVEEVQPLTVGDLCEIVGTDRKVADFVKTDAGDRPAASKRRGGVSSLF